MSNYICPQCGKENGYNNCEQCGHDHFKTEWVCPVCDHTNHRLTRICHGCERTRPGYYIISDGPLRLFGELIPCPRCATKVRPDRLDYHFANSCPKTTPTHVKLDPGLHAARIRLQKVQRDLRDAQGD